MNPNLIPRAPKRKKQPTAEMMREQLRLAADRIIELERVIDTTKRLMGWDRPGPPEPPEPPRNRDVTGRGYRLSWYRRLWNRLRVRVVETDPETAAAMPPMEE